MTLPLVFLVFIQLPNLHQNPFVIILIVTVKHIKIHPAVVITTNVIVADACLIWSTSTSAIAMAVTLDKYIKRSFSNRKSIIFHTPLTPKFHADILKRSVHIMQE